jgi:hypothetical protein
MNSEAPKHCLFYRADGPADKATIEAALSKSSALKSIQDTKLKPMMAWLATHPVELHQTIIDALSSMLELKMNINQRATSHLRFQEQLPLRDPTSGKTQKNPESGEPIMVNFIPRSF